MAKYKKKRARELKHDKFRDTTMGIFDRLGDMLAGKGRLVLYIIGGVVLAALLAGLWSWRSAKKADEARRALGRAIEIASTPIIPNLVPGSTMASYPDENTRAQRAVEEFQKVADKYGDPYRSNARYLMATNLLKLDRTKALAELDSLSKSGEQDIATLSKFALAQAKEEDGKLDEAASLYKELAGQGSTIITPETANLRLASVYEKQGKKKEAADLLYPIVENARKAKDADGKPAPQSEASRNAAEKLEKLDPDRFAKLPPEPSMGNLGI
ncbi:MAG: tetratricopeptide repeat protein [Pyrinomonadaceae bacterium]